MVAHDDFEMDIWKYDWLHEHSMNCTKEGFTLVFRFLLLTLRSAPFSFVTIPSR